MHSYASTHVEAVKFESYSSLRALHLLQFVTCPCCCIYLPSSCHRNLTEFTPPSLLISADHSGCSHFLTALQQVCLCYVTILRVKVLPIHTVRLSRIYGNVQLDSASVQTKVLIKKEMYV